MLQKILENGKNYYPKDGWRWHTYLIIVKSQVVKCDRLKIFITFQGTIFFSILK